MRGMAHSRVFIGMEQASNAEHWVQGRCSFHVRIRREPVDHLPMISFNPSIT